MVSSDHVYVLVTGANSGLGLNVCYRLIEDFVRTRPSSSRLTLIFTTRSSKKSADTLKLLRARLDRSRKLSRSTHEIDFIPENVELTSLLSVRALARHLLNSSIHRLDVIILNAGIIGVVGIDWPLATWTVLVDNVNALTWPRFKLSVTGLITKRQVPPVDGQDIPEPPLGEVFCANVFGHYLLAHWLMPLLRSCNPESPGKVIWVGSIECAAEHFDISDLQGFRSPKAYEHSKRLTDLLALTAQDQPATSRSVQAYMTPSPAYTAPNNASKAETHSTPEIHVVHPGICVTAMVPLYWIVQQCFLLAAYLSRLLGSPWALVTAYNGAHAISWLALASTEEIETKKAEDVASGEEIGGAVKFGSATTRWGALSVRETEVEGWGLDGSGSKYGETWWAGKMGRRREAVDATSEDVERFVEDGAKAWKAMEKLKLEWEERLEEYDRLSDKAISS